MERVLFPRIETSIFNYFMPLLNFFKHYKILCQQFFCLLAFQFTFSVFVIVQFCIYIDRNHITIPVSFVKKETTNFMLDGISFFASRIASK